MDIVLVACNHSQKYVSRPHDISPVGYANHYLLMVEGALNWKYTNIIAHPFHLHKFKGIDYIQVLINYDRNRLKNILKVAADRNIAFELYPEKFFQLRHGVKTWGRILGKTLVETFDIQSLVDFGCGTGSHIAGALEAGAKVQGLELMPVLARQYTDKFIRPYIEYGNVGQYLDCGKWDCVLSIEVAEHLPEEEADVFVENIVRAMSRMAVITSSWRPYRYHLNPREPKYWIKKFGKLGSKVLKNERDRLEKAWREIGVLDYFINKMMVFGAVK
ncbi:MAG TPA: class I SAM-dependent methyltransferase [bacterium]|nr:class I SAM-dependent methyltransferase [bacterium]